ncbi:MAG: site-2 protease family protein [Phycisphaerae bacterium]
MSFAEKPMDNPINWSFKAFRLFAIDVRVHVFFLIGAVILIAMESSSAEASGVPALRHVFNALGTYALLFFVVLVHEFGHCWGARTTGGEANEILIWPLGGLAMTRPPHEPRAHMITTLAGPAVNVLFCALASLVLVLWTGRLGSVPWNPFYPTTPVDSAFFPVGMQVWVIRFFAVSYVLLIINMFPIFPFDGGRVLQAWLWPRRGYRASMEIATSTGMIGAIVVGLLGFLSGASLLIMIAVFGYIQCWKDRRMLAEQAQYESEYGLDYGQFSEFGAAPDDEVEPRPGFVKRWRTRREEARKQREAEAEEARQALVESALKQVAELGEASLSAKQRRALEEETRRLRTIDQDVRDS